MITVFDYIAKNNPAGAKNVIHSFGYQQTQNSLGLANDLRVLVNQEGESALNKIMDIHPDKDFFIETYSTPLKPKPKKCTSCQNNSAYLNATGPAMNQASVLGSQGNTFILAAAFMLAVAIIVKN